MIQEVTCYKCHCDGCGEVFCEEYREGFTIFSDEGQLTESLEEAGWYSSFDKDNKQYCPKCHEINDNDELVLKGKAAILADKPIKP